MVSWCCFLYPWSYLFCSQSLSIWHLWPQLHLSRACAAVVKTSRCGPLPSSAIFPVVWFLQIGSVAFASRPASTPTTPCYLDLVAAMPRVGAMAWRLRYCPLHHSVLMLPRKEAPCPAMYRRHLLPCWHLRSGTDRPICFWSPASVTSGI